MSQDESGDDEGPPEEGARSERGADLSRRKLVASGAVTWATMGLAGCAYITDPGPEESGDDGGETEADTDTDIGTGDDGQTDDGAETTASDGTGNNTTVSNETTTTESGGGGGCASLRRFAAGMDIAMNVNVFDQGSGEHLGAGSVDAVKVEFPEANFDALELDWSGPHEEFTEEQWGGKLSTTEDVEPGTYQYEIVVEGEEVDGEERIADQFTIV